MSHISTEFTRLLGISSPIASAPMAYATTPAVVAAVIKAGGIGFLGAGNESASKLAEMIHQARAGLSPEQQSLVGMGFVGWVLDRFNTDADPRLRTVLDLKVSGIWLAFGPDLGKYVSQIREHSQATGHNTRVLVNVNTVEEARKAVEEWQADVVIVQGAEAGGRGSTKSPPTFDFIKQVLSALPNHPPILAAGGIMSGSQIAALLELGAAGAVLGTRFLFTPESMYSDEMKEVLVAAGAESTIRSPAYDVAFPPGVWPTDIQARCVKNAIIDEYEAGVSTDERKAKLQNSDSEHLIVYAGTGVSEVNLIQPAQVVVETIHREILDAQKSSA